MPLTESVLPAGQPQAVGGPSLCTVPIYRSSLEQLATQIQHNGEAVLAVWSSLPPEKRDGNDLFDSTEMSSEHIQHSPPRPGHYGKDLYMLTPVRVKYFPTLSPTILRMLLSTPPLRVSTPDIYLSEEHSFSPHHPDIGISAGGTLSVLDDGSTVELDYSGMLKMDATRASCADPDWSFDDTGYLPTPPPSSKLPDVKGFSPTHDPYVQPTGTASATDDFPSPAEERRLGRDVRSPLSPLSIASHSGLRTAKSDLHALTHSKSMTSLTTAMQLHAHTGLSVGALQNFHRVMDELRGSREGNESAELGALQKASPPSTVRRPTVLAEDGPAGLRQFGAAELGDEAPHPPSPLLSRQVNSANRADSASDETSNWLIQASEEEHLAAELIALAETLKTTAKRRRQIVRAHAGMAEGFRQLSM